MRIRGVVKGTRQGFAFLTPEEGGEDLFIPGDALGGAIHGDLVEATLVRRSPRDYRSEAQVERVLERRQLIHTGNAVRLARTLFVVPDAAVLPPRVRLKAGSAVVPDGAKVLFRLDPVPPGSPMIAILESVLGDAEDPLLDALVVATAHQLPGRFPDEAVDEALAAVSRVDAEDLARRVDYSDRLVLTIDPIDAKDFDDAVSLSSGPDGYRLDVHIADVSWYVEEGGALDREAARRGNSVYFPGSVIPMLPEALSTRTASLVPGEERRVITVEMEISHDGELRASRVREGRIRSAARLHYEQAQRMLAGDEGDPEVRGSIRAMGRLAEALRARRFRAGGFDLEVPETEVRLDARGMPARIERHRTLASHRLIEEFMILANRAVGGMLHDAGLPVVYRVHAEPEIASLERFAEIVLTVMPSVSTREVESLPALRRFLASMPDTPMRRIVHGFFLRSLKQAVYSPMDVGHFGLGIDRYCHFTSPIRRYPDLINHRIVRWLIRRGSGEGQSDAAGMRAWHEGARLHAIHCTRTEREAEAAERAMIRLKCLRWAERRLGEIFAGRVVGMVGAGLFVELEKVPVDGFVPREGLGWDARFVEERLAFVEGRSRSELRLGDRVEVQIVRVNLRERTLEFGIVGRGGGAGGDVRSKGMRRAKGSAPRPSKKRGSGKRQRVKMGGQAAERGRGPKGSKVRRQPRSRRGGGR